MDLNLIFDAVFADDLPTEAQKTPILNFTLGFSYCAAYDCLGGRERREKRLGQRLIYHSFQ